MTFLEFVCRRLLGPPVCGSCWRCPYCDSSGASFSVRPPKVNPATGEPYPIKFKCHRASCQKFGDEYDLAKLFYPEDDFADRLERVRAWRKRYDAMLADSSSGDGERGESGATAEDAVSAILNELIFDFPRGPGGDAASAVLRYLVDPPSIRQMTEALKLLQAALAICAEHSVAPAELAWRLGREAEHVAEQGRSTFDCPGCDSLMHGPRRCREAEPLETRETLAAKIECAGVAPEHRAALLDWALGREYGSE